MSDATENDVILGALKLTGKIDCECFTSWADFIAKLPNFFSVEIPSSITNVIVSVDQPDDNQHDCVWFRIAPSGSFTGIYIYAMGDWRQIFPHPNELIRMYGDSRSVPSGYALVDASNPHFTAPEIAAIQASWYPDPLTTPLYFTIFDVTYEGF